MSFTMKQFNNILALIINVDKFLVIVGIPPILEDNENEAIPAKTI